jgi:hypothetical protein
MSRALARKVGLLLLSTGCIVIGIAIWSVPEKWFDSGDRLAGAALICCGVIFAVLSLLLRPNLPAKTDGGEPNGSVADTDPEGDRPTAGSGDPTP